METAIVGAIAIIISAAISASVSLATQRRATKAAAAVTAQTSFADLVKDAGTIAAGVYQGTIEQLEREQREDRAEIADLKGRVRTLEQERAAMRAEHEREVGELRRELEAAKTALRLALPDES